MAKNIERDKVRARNAAVGITFDKSEEITSQIKGTLGTGAPTNFYFGLDDEGGWLSWEQVRTHVVDGKETEQSARVTVYMAPAVIARFMEAMEHERFSKARDSAPPPAAAPPPPPPPPQPAPTEKSNDWNPFR